MHAHDKTMDTKPNWDFEKAARIPPGREKAYENAVIDCNYLIARGNKMLLLLGRPIVYGAPLLLTKSISTGILVNI
jgi:hypothetical protein